MRLKLVEPFFRRLYAAGPAKIEEQREDQKRFSGLPKKVQIKINAAKQSFVPPEAVFEISRMKEFELKAKYARTFRTICGEECVCVFIIKFVENMLPRA